MRELFFILVCTFSFIGCTSKRELSPLEIKMKKNDMFPIIDNVYNSKILKINYLKGVPFDTCVCDLESFAIDVNDPDSIKYLYFIHPFANALSEFTNAEIYKYRTGDRIKKDGHEYVIVHAGEELRYYFDNGKMPRKIKKMDKKVQLFLLCPQHLVK